jgi:NAD(P)-dependent dehydrogenase (short-subunit alcohol dehydrogenase family)
MKVAIITGASRGLGLALSNVLADRGWALVIDARDPKALGAAETALAELTTVRAVPGDVTDPDHRHRLITTAIELGGAIDAVVNNASYLGPSPQPPLAHYPLDVVRRVYEVNVFAPLALVQEALPSLRPGGRIVNVTSDAAVEAYEGWGGYGSSKAALEQVTAVLGAERPDLRVYRVDPGDLRTQMHQEAFPDEDISDRPLPEVAVPGLVHLLEGDEPSGRYRAQELVPA